MNRAILMNIVRFGLLILAQVLIFNQINLFGFINPYPYILFILLYPVNSNKAGLLISSFLLGLTLDYFTDSAGIHAGACLILANLRPTFFKFAFGLSYEYQTVRILDKLSPERFTFILISIFTHHIILFLYEYFKFYFILDILWKTLLSSIFTLIVCILLIYLFRPNNRR